MVVRVVQIVPDAVPLVEATSTRYVVALTIVATAEAVTGIVMVVRPVVTLHTVIVPPPITVVADLTVIRNSAANPMLVIEAVRVVDAQVATATEPILRVMTQVPGAAAVVTVPVILMRIVLPAVADQRVGVVLVPTPVPIMLVMVVAAPLVPSAVAV